MLIFISIVIYHSISIVRKILFLTREVQKSENSYLQVSGVILRENPGENTRVFHTFTSEYMENLVYGK